MAAAGLEAALQQSPLEESGFRGHADDDGFSCISGRPCLDKCFLLEKKIVSYQIKLNKEQWVLLTAQ